MPPSTAGCGGLPTSHAAHSPWPPSSATPRHVVVRVGSAGGEALWLVESDEREIDDDSLGVGGD
jgi:hypothetical protein